MAAGAPLLSTTPTCSPSPLPGEGTMGDAVYVASVPLRAAKGPAQLAVSAAYSLGVWDLQHFMVVVKPHHSKAFVFDFQPKDPEDIYVAVAGLSRNRVPGVVLKRKISRLPRSRCWFVGFSCPDDINVADKFSENWHPDLIIGEHDCRHFTNGLVGYLTGRPNILDYLRETFHGQLLLHPYSY